MDPLTNSARLFKKAFSDLGITELPGPRSQPRIQHAIKLAADWLDPDDGQTPWCGCIMGLWCYELGLGLPIAHYRAANWVNVGRAVHNIAEARQGDILVFSLASGNHVTLFDSVANLTPTGKPLMLRCLGGNQSDSVKFSSFPVSRLLATRRI